MSSCVSSQPSSDRAAPQDELGGGGGSSSLAKARSPVRPCGASPPEHSPGHGVLHRGHGCGEPACVVDYGLTRDRPLEAHGGEITLRRLGVSGPAPPLQSQALSAGAVPAGCQWALRLPGAALTQWAPRSPRRGCPGGPRWSRCVSITGMQVRERAALVPTLHPECLYLEAGVPQKDPSATS